MILFVLPRQFRPYDTGKFSLVREIGPHEPSYVSPAKHLGTVCLAMSLSLSLCVPFWEKILRRSPTRLSALSDGTGLRSQEKKRSSEFRLVREVLC